MKLRLFNSQSRKKEEITGKKIGIYVCGSSPNPDFDVNIPRDYTGLVEAMKRFR